MLKFHLTGSGLIVGAVVLAVNGLPIMAAMALYCAYSHAKCGPCNG